MDKVKVCSVHGGDPIPISNFAKNRNQCRDCYNKLRNFYASQRARDLQKKTYRKVSATASVGSLSIRNRVHYYVVPGIHRPQRTGIIQSFKEAFPLEKKIQMIKYAVTYVTGISENLMRRKNRKEEVFVARHLCAWYLIYNTPLRLTSIDFEIREKGDHSQIVAARKWMQTILDQPGEDSMRIHVQEMMAQIERLLTQSVFKGADWLLNLPVQTHIRKQRKPSILLKHIPHEQPKINRAKW